MKEKARKREMPLNRFFKGIVNRENVEAIIIAVVLALFIRTFVVQAFKIPSGSMEPTLLIGDHILVNKFIFGITIPLTDIKIAQFYNPKRNDVIVFKFPGDPSKDFIKRVIAIAGDQIQIKNKKIYINGIPFTDKYGVYREKRIIKGEEGQANRDNYGPKKVPPNSLFVMGDNRDRSYDSRFWGVVDVKKVKGKAFLIYWSWESFLRNIRWDRIGNIIH
jgi:signal peptidase I